MIHFIIDSALQLVGEVNRVFLATRYTHFSNPHGVALVSWTSNWGRILGEKRANREPLSLCIKRFYCFAPCANIGFVCRGPGPLLDSDRYQDAAQLRSEFFSHWNRFGSWSDQGKHPVQQRAVGRGGSRTGLLPQPGIGWGAAPDFPQMSSERLSYRIWQNVFVSLSRSNRIQIWVFWIEEPKPTWMATIKKWKKCLQSIGFRPPCSIYAFGFYQFSNKKTTFRFVIVRPSYRFTAVFRFNVCIDGFALLFVFRSECSLFNLLGPLDCRTAIGEIAYLSWSLQWDATVTFHNLNLTRVQKIPNGFSWRK